MNDIRLTSKAEREIEESFELDRKAWWILDLITAEFESDPTSVQCFDLRLVDEARRIVNRHKALRHLRPFEGDDKFRL